MFPLETLAHIKGVAGAFCRRISHATSITVLNINCAAEGSTFAANLSRYASAVGCCGTLLESSANFCCVYPTFFNVALIAVASL